MPYLFGQLKQIARRWIDEGYLVCKGGTFPAQLLYQEIADKAVERVYLACQRSLQGEKRIKAIPDPYNPAGSTTRVSFTTSRKTRWRTSPERCHVNWVVCDSEWEAEFARDAEAHPRAKARYAAVLKAPVYFEQPQIAVVFSKEVLAVPVKGADHRLLRILETHCCEILGQGAESDTAFDVRQVLTRTPFGRGAQDRANGGRAEHERPHAGATLERKGLDLQTGGRRPAPPAGAPYVKDPRIRLSQLGFLLGFSENAAFVHAFRRWTGSTPMRYRAAHGGDHASAARARGGSRCKELSGAVRPPSPA